MGWIGTSMGGYDRLGRPTGIGILGWGGHVLEENTHRQVRPEILCPFY
jgi:hypothetical protein